MLYLNLACCNCGSVVPTDRGRAALNYGGDRRTTKQLWFGGPHRPWQGLH